LKLTKIDFHVHSVYSKDGYSTPRQIIKFCKLRGIDGIVLADNSIAAANEIKKEILCIPACEIKTEFGEILGIFINEQVKNRLFHDVLDEIKEMDGLIGLPHPFDTLRRFSIKKNIYKVLNKIDFIEGFNSRCLTNRPNNIAQSICKKFKIPMTAGSDAHIPLEIGNAYTLFEEYDVEEIKKAVKKNKTKIFGKLSPFYVHFFSITKKYLS
jgi:predicted metal-dependent phosphoesterase TrpH